MEGSYFDEIVKWRHINLLLQYSTHKYIIENIPKFSKHFFCIILVPASSPLDIFGKRLMKQMEAYMTSPDWLENLQNGSKGKSSGNFSGIPFKVYHYIRSYRRYATKLIKLITSVTSFAKVVVHMIGFICSWLAYIIIRRHASVNIYSYFIHFWHK